MINPEILEVEAEGIFTSVPDHAQDSESVMVYPDLLKFLKQKQWKLMSGHSPTSRYTDDFRSRLTTGRHRFYCHFFFYCHFLFYCHFYCHFYCQWQ